MVVVVIGAGAIGLAAATRLARRAHVVVLDRAGVGSGASTQNAGILRSASTDPVERAMAARSLELWSTLPGAPYRRTGGFLGRSVQSDTQRAELEATRTGLVDLGTPARWQHLDVWGRRVEGLMVESDGVAEPDEACTWLASRAAATGVEVLTQLEVMELLADPVIRGVRTNRGSLGADRVVLAAGEWSTRLAPGLPDLQRIRRHVFKSTGGPRPQGPWVWLEDDSVYARPDAHGWWMSTCDGHLEAEPSTDQGRREPTADAWKEARQRWSATTGHQGTELTSGWSGIRSFTQDGRPLLGASKRVDGLVVATAFGGYGMTCCLAAAEAVEAAVFGDPAPTWWDAHATRPDRYMPSTPMTR